MKLKLDTFIIISKGLAYVFIGAFTPWSAALAQWVGTNNWPERIVWIGVILPASVIGGATQWLAFCSGSWNTYHQQQKADKTGEAQTVTTQPAPTIAEKKEQDKP